MHVAPADDRTKWSARDTSFRSRCGCGDRVILAQRMSPEINTGLMPLAAANVADRLPTVSRFVPKQNPGLNQSLPSANSLPSQVVFSNSRQECQYSALNGGAALNV